MTVPKHKKANVGDSGFNIRRTSDDPEALYVVERSTKVAISIVALDWDWTYLKRTTVQKSAEEIDANKANKLWWHRMSIEAIENMKLHLRIDHMHIATYIGDHEPTADYISYLKNQYEVSGPNSAQVHDGTKSPSTHLPDEL